MLRVANETEIGATCAAAAAQNPPTNERHVSIAQRIQRDFKSMSIILFASIFRPCYCCVVFHCCARSPHRARSLSRQT